MNNDTCEIYAYMKLIDKEIEGMLKEREQFRQKLIQLVPGIENMPEFKEMQLAPKEEDIKTYEIGGQNEIDKTKIL